MCIRDRMEVNYSMPIRIQADLPAIEVLESENIFVMTHERAALQDIRIGLPGMLAQVFAGYAVLRYLLRN